MFENKILEALDFVFQNFKKYDKDVFPEEKCVVQNHGYLESKEKYFCILAHPNYPEKIEIKLLRIYKHNIYKEDIGWFDDEETISHFTGKFSNNELMVVAWKEI